MTDTTKKSFTQHKREKFLEKAKAKCKVCALPPELQAQIKEAREAGGTSRELIAWLQDEYKRELAVSEFQVHANGKHDLA